MASKTITATAFLALLRSTKGSDIATITTVTEPAMPKTGNPFLGVKKVSTMNVIIGFDYASCVNKQRTREEMEADFIAQPRKWGERKDTKTVEHKGQTYISLLSLRSLDTVYIKGGKEVVKADIAPFLRESTQAETQGTEKAVVYRDVKLCNVTRIKMRGEDYNIIS